MKNYSKRLIDVIEYSREEAARLQNSYIGPEHLMLGIIREGEGEAMRVLRELHTDPMDIKRKIEQEIKNTFDSEDSVQHEIAISKTTERVLRMSMLSRERRWSFREKSWKSRNIAAMGSRAWATSRSWWGMAPR